MPDAGECVLEHCPVVPVEVPASQRAAVIPNHHAVWVQHWHHLQEQRGNGNTIERCVKTCHLLQWDIGAFRCYLPPPASPWKQRCPWAAGRRPSRPAGSPTSPPSSRIRWSPRGALGPWPPLLFWPSPPPLGAAPGRWWSACARDSRPDCGTAPGACSRCWLLGRRWGGPGIAAGGSRCRGSSGPGSRCLSHTGTGRSRWASAMRGHRCRFPRLSYRRKVCQTCFVNEHVLHCMFYIINLMSLADTAKINNQAPPLLKVENYQSSNGYCVHCALLLVFTKDESSHTLKSLLCTVWDFKYSTANTTKPAALKLAKQTMKEQVKTRVVVSAGGDAYLTINTDLNIG